jgi:hypothetical protein
MSGAGSVKGRVLAGIAVMVVLAVALPGLRPVLMLVGCAGLIALVLVERGREARRWHERLSANTEDEPNRLELFYDGEVLDPQWPLRVELDDTTRKVTIERRKGLAGKPTLRHIAFDQVEYLRYQRHGSHGLSIALALKDDEKVPLVKLEPSAGQRRRCVVLQEPGEPELVFDGIDERQSQFLVGRLRALLGVGMARPLPENLGFAEATPTCDGCHRPSPPGKACCMYCGGVLAAPPSTDARLLEPAVYEIS